MTQVADLALLVPDSMQKIMSGALPLDVNIKCMLAASPLPLDWAKQRQALGFDGWRRGG